MARHARQMAQRMAVEARQRTGSRNGGVIDVHDGPSLRATAPPSARLP
jgi:hypothetical protein